MQALDSWLIHHRGQDKISEKIQAGVALSLICGERELTIRSVHAVILATPRNIMN